ncbi:MAG: phosphoribosylformylglycinamidine synthase subunit PurQ [Desulfobacteraceae bacterium]|nr:phosphoribosylformylglycinamidine synthase subunit PurQ [Desulfobacteraceae bacterium]
MSKVNVLVLTGYGLNCDNETAYAFEQAGADTDRVHINALIDGSVSLDKYQIMAFIGGFSWGDDHGGGVIQSVRMQTNIGDQMSTFIAEGKLIIGICNGFQALVNIGLLPGIDGDYVTRSVAVTYNDCGNYRDQWVSLKVNGASPCIFTKGLDQVEYPIRHGEGKFFADSRTIERLVGNDQIVLQYALADGIPANLEFPHNPNGSILDIAGICDSTGRIFGLMPHPEAFNHWTNHPDWSRRNELIRRGLSPAPGRITPGIQLFKNAVDYF